jgi:hypothetical protein
MAIAGIPWPIDAVGVASARPQALDINMPKEKTFVTNNIQINDLEGLQIARISK